jgi:hypothetical protein
MNSKNSKNRDLCIIAVARAYEVGDASLISRIEAAVLPDQVKLPAELEDVLNKWGTTPIAEPEMFQMIKTESLENVKDKAVKGLDIDNFTALDISTLTYRVIDRITRKTDTEGVYKTTQQLDSMKLPKTSAIREIKQMIVNGAVEADIEQKAFESVGFSDRNVLSEWEQELVLELLKDFINAVDSDSIGATADRTPFARYLKN